jgi:3',5'-cyclic AMP phosphodiesterase CpdA
MRNFATDPQYFAGACDAIMATGKGDFMISPGDIDPPDDVLSTIRAHIPDAFPWIPVVGNHEIDTAYGSPHAFSYSIEWIRSYSNPFSVSTGPSGAEKTCFSFDFGNAHFTILNEYYDGTFDNVLLNGHGYLSAQLLSWMTADLAATAKPVIFVIGHEPAFPQPDAESGRVRHLGESLDADTATRDLFWNTLSQYKVKAYICGHTHDYSVYKTGTSPVWQVDVGHARGTGDTGARSTFVRIFVRGDATVSYETWRLNLTTGKYEITNAGDL